MKISKFKVGDRVVVTGGVLEVKKGMVGIVVDFNWCGEHVLVKFDGWHNGHDGIGATASGKRYDGNACYYIPDTLLKKINETIVLYRKNNRVIALDKSTGEKAEAICSTEDTFDFRTGAKLAFQRLLGEIPEEAPTPTPEPVKYNGKVIFTKGDAIFKTGHIYEVKDGKLIVNAKKYPSRGDDFFTSYADIKAFFNRDARKRSSWNYSRHLKLIEVLED
mgnify:CR=1 FL=1